MSEQTSSIDSLLQSLVQFRDARIRQRKSQIAKDFLLARSTIRNLYKEWPPEDLPLDVNRIAKDIDIERDLIIDRACDEIHDDFKIVVGVLRMVADEHPDYYERVAKAVGDSRSGWRSRSRSRVSSVPKGVPMGVVSSLGASYQKSVVDLIVASGLGLTFRDLCSKLWPKGAMGPQKKGLRAFLQFLASSGHVLDDGGKTSSRRYSPTPSLLLLAKSYGDQS